MLFQRSSYPDGMTRRNLLAGAASALAVQAAPKGTDPLDWTLTEASAALARRIVSSEELTKLCLARIAKLDGSEDGKLNAFITVDGDRALEQARACDRSRGGQNRLLHGIPIALKDNFDTAGLKTTAAANVFKDR
ncbi:MAG TPA: amidase family protein, partial [Bryobacteraceae bacterium]